MPAVDWSLINETAKSLKGTYARALVRVRQRIGLLYQYFGKPDGTLDIAALQNSARGMRILDELQAWAEALRKRAPQEIRQALNGSYVRAIKSAVQDVRKFGIDTRGKVNAWESMGRRIVDRPVKGPSLAQTVARNEALSATRLNQSIGLMIWQGATDAEALSAFKAFFENEAGRMLRILDTEGGRVVNEARAQVFDFAVEVDASGEVEKYWDATKDSHTREDHAMLDGEAADEDGLWHIGSLSASGPGGWGDPAQDCNCRCEIGIRRRTA